MSSGKKTKSVIPKNALHELDELSNDADLFRNSASESEEERQKAEALNVLQN